MSSQMSERSYLGKRWEESPEPNISEVYRRVSKTPQREKLYEYLSFIERKSEAILERGRLLVAIQQAREKGYPEETVQDLWKKKCQEDDMVEYWSRKQERCLQWTDFWIEMIVAEEEMEAYAAKHWKKLFDLKDF